MPLEVTRMMDGWMKYSVEHAQSDDTTERRGTHLKRYVMLTFGFLEDTINGARAAAAGHSDVEVVVMDHDGK